MRAMCAVPGFGAVIPVQGACFHAVREKTQAHDDRNTQAQKKASCQSAQEQEKVGSHTLLQRETGDPVSCFFVTGFVPAGCRYTPGMFFKDEVSSDETATLLPDTTSLPSRYSFRRNLPLAGWALVFLTRQGHSR